VTPRELAAVAARAADDAQAHDVVVLDVGDVLAITECFVIASAGNARLVRTVVDKVEAAIREATGRSPRGVEGLGESQWVLADYGDVVVHVFLDATREYYDIERLYLDVPAVEWRAGAAG